MFHQEEWPSETRYVEAYQEQEVIEPASWISEWITGYEPIQYEPVEHGAAGGYQVSPSTYRDTGLLPTLNSIIASLGSLFGKYSEVEAAKARARAATVPAGYKPPTGVSLAGFGLSTNAMLLIGGGLLAAVLMMGKKKRGASTASTSM